MRPPPTTPHITTHSPLKLDIPQTRQTQNISTHTDKHIRIIPLIVTAQYQHVAITLISHQLLKMGTWLSETCWATCKGEIKDNAKVTSSWFLIHNDIVVFDCIPFPSFTHTTGMTHFLDRKYVYTDRWHGPRTCHATWKTVVHPYAQRWQNL